jgi:hypothetical protein
VGSLVNTFSASDGKIAGVIESLYAEIDALHQQDEAEG